MVLVDTSIWVDFFRKGDKELSLLLQQGDVCCHPFILGELALGYLSPREKILALLATLPTIPATSNQETMDFIETHKLFGLGLGLIDIHLLTSSLLGRASLWTRDKKLVKAAEKLHIAF